jgi:hypothetical protein
MEENKAVIGALLFILLVVGANFILYGIVRGAANSKQKGFLETIGKSLNQSVKRDDPMEELHQKLEELKKDGKE